MILCAVILLKSLQARIYILLQWLIKFEFNINYGRAGINIIIFNNDDNTRIRNARTAENEFTSASTTLRVKLIVKNLTTIIRDLGNELLQKKKITPLKYSSSRVGKLVTL